MLPQDVEDNVRLIHESVMLEVQLIDDLLDLTKISRYTTPLPPPQPFSAPACDSFRKALCSLLAGVLGGAGTSSSSTCGR
jgi:hypothetical protein